MAGSLLKYLSAMFIWIDFEGKRVNVTSHIFPFIPFVKYMMPDLGQNASPCRRCNSLSPSGSSLTYGKVGHPKGSNNSKVMSSSKSAT